MTTTAYEAAAARAYAEGRREQRCPNCGREEAGGSYCTGCCRPTHPDQWTNDTAQSRAGRANNARRAGGASFRAARADEPPKPSHRPLAPPPTRTDSRSAPDDPLPKVPPRHYTSGDLNY